MSCINCGYDEEQHKSPFKGGPCFGYSEPPDGFAEWWYMSIVNAETHKFAGALIMPGRTFLEAQKLSWEKKLNPGGEIQFVPLMFEDLEMIPENCRERLLTKQQVLNLGN